MKNKKPQQEIINKINKDLDRKYIKNSINKKKVFYNYNEWFGWRFWFKAIRNLDFKSMGTKLKWHYQDLLTLIGKGEND